MSGAGICAAISTWPRSTASRQLWRSMTRPAMSQRPCTGWWKPTWQSACAARRAPSGAVLGYNFPDSDWYRDSYRLLVDEGLDPDAVDGEQGRGWLSRIF